VKAAVALAVAVGVVVAPASSAKGVGAARPPVALSVSPARIAVTAPGSRAIRLRNVGAGDVVVDTTRKPLGARAPASGWVTIAPRRLLLRPGDGAALTLRVAPRSGAAPGDHHVLVLLGARQAETTHVLVRLRLGVVVRVRVQGRIVRSLQLGRLNVARRGRARLLSASVANRGNVSEDLRNRATIALGRHGRVFARFRAAAPRELFPGTRAGLRARYRGRVRGIVRAVVTVRVGERRRPLRRSYAIRL
jgi:hypothetical protein